MLANPPRPPARIGRLPRRERASFSVAARLVRVSAVSALLARGSPGMAGKQIAHAGALVVSVALSIAVLAHGSAQAKAGDLDRSFGSDGTVTTNIGSAHASNWGDAMAIDGRGRIVVAEPNSCSLATCRAGAIDSANAVAIDSRRRIVTVGSRGPRRWRAGRLRARAVHRRDQDPRRASGRALTALVLLIRRGEGAKTLWRLRRPRRRRPRCPRPHPHHRRWRRYPMGRRPESPTRGFATCPPGHPAPCSWRG